MKLHQTVIDKLVRTYDLHGGRKDNNKLIAELLRLDLTPYQQKENPKAQSFLVLTETLVAAQQAKK
jgi:hypothetical protein